MCAFVVFLCLPFIAINHTAYILTKGKITFVKFENKTLIKKH